MEQSNVITLTFVGFVVALFAGGATFVYHQNVVSSMQADFDKKEAVLKAKISELEAMQGVVEEEMVEEK